MQHINPQASDESIMWYSMWDGQIVLFLTICSITYISNLLAETEGFEPSIRCNTYDDLANRCLQPLGHVSGGWAFAAI